jgi:hypothetical protein
VSGHDLVGQQDGATHHGLRRPGIVAVPANAARSPRIAVSLSPRLWARRANATSASMGSTWASRAMCAIGRRVSLFGESLRQERGVEHPRGEPRLWQENRVRGLRQRPQRVRPWASVRARNAGVIVGAMGGSWPLTA